MNTIRGGFGHAFRRIVCVYLRKGNVALVYYGKSVFIVDLSIRDHCSDTEITFGLILIGKAIDYLPYFIYAFEELGRIGIDKGRGSLKLLSSWPKMSE